MSEDEKEDEFSEADDEERDPEYIPDETVTESEGKITTMVFIIHLFFSLEFKFFFFFTEVEEDQIEENKEERKSNNLYKITVNSEIESTFNVSIEL